MLLGAGNRQRSVFPVEILKTNPLHLPCPKPIDSEEQQDGSVASVNRTIRFSCGQQALDVSPSRPLRKLLVTVHAWSVELCADAWLRPSVSLSIVKKAA